MPGYGWTTSLIIYTLKFFLQPANTCWTGPSGFSRSLNILLGKSPPSIFLIRVEHTGSLIWDVTRGALLRSSTLRSECLSHVARIYELGGKSEARKVGLGWDRSGAPEIFAFFAISRTPNRPFEARLNTYFRFLVCLIESDDCDSLLFTDSRFQE